VAIVVACSVDNVDARDFDQSCSTDADCVLVAELLASGTDCAIGCPQVGLNKKEKARYDAKLAEEREGCRSESLPDCELRTPACSSGVCVAVDPTALADGGRN